VSGPSPEETRYTVVAATAFVLGTLAAVAFAVLYGLGEDAVGDDHIQWLGASLATALAGIGVGLVAWAKALMPPGPHVEERETGAPRPASREETIATTEEHTRTVGRRRLMGRLLTAAAATTGLAVLFPIRSLSRNPFPERVSTGWFEGVHVVDVDGHAVHRDDLEINSVLTVFPEGRTHEADSQTILVRVDAARLPGPEPDRGGSPAGYLAFSKVCTHAGCPVGLYQVESQRLLCPCHQSAFDVLAGAAPIFGPATRPLPRLPLGVDAGGFLVARGDFDRPVGNGFWTYPRHVGRGAREDGGEAES
jgi:ubiquinol-cytochrome c reductase iron-sulfur subunit